jgi:quercetin dioxygenase-like cupin family protein
MSALRPPYLRDLSSFREYSDPGSLNQVCRDLLDKGAGEARHLQVGICSIDGPGHVAEDRHTGWTQYFLVIEGSGTLSLHGADHRIVKGMIIEIPKGARHSTRCEFGEHLSYFFINLHDRE